MTSAIYYVEKPKLYVGVIDGAIYKIQRAPRSHKINPHAIIADHFDATFDAIRVADNRLYLDWFALTDLMAWLYREYPNATEKGYINRLLDLFPGSMNINDVMRALMRCISNNEHLAHGEDAHFCGHIRRMHKHEFEEIRAAWFAQIRQSGRPSNNVQ